MPGPNLTSRRFSTFRLQRPSYDCSGVLYILTGDSIIIYKLRWRKNSVGPCANLELMVPEHLTDPTRSPRPDSSLQIKKGEKKKKFLAGILRHESSTLALSFTIPCQLSTSKNALNQKRRDDWKEMESVTTWIFRFDAKSTWAYLPPFFVVFFSIEKFGQVFCVWHLPCNVTWRSLIQMRSTVSLVVERRQRSLKLRPKRNRFCSAILYFIKNSQD